MASIFFQAEAEAMRDELITRRRDFHRHPELAFEEFRTAGIVAEELSKLGLEVQTGIGKTGVVGLLEGDEDGPTILVRADMDALPVSEENQTDYVSTVPGKMHACGHDGHTAIALGVAKLLSRHREHMAGRVKFVFQPAEEMVGGAKAMVEDGVLENPRPDVTLGLHLWNTFPLGLIGVVEGPVMAGAASFTLKIKGRGGHAAGPHYTVDPVVCAAQLVSAFQTIVSRNVSPFDTGVVSVTYVRAGEATNIIPQEAELRGTIRAFKREVRALLEQRMQQLAEDICRGMGCAAELIFYDRSEPVVNHPEVTARVRTLFEEMVGKDNLNTQERTMGAEDVGLLMTDIPGTYFFLGSANAERGLNYAHHHPRFDFDEDALPLGVALMSAAVASYVLPEA
jgi:amidohydrolase